MSGQVRHTRARRLLVSLSLLAIAAIGPVPAQASVTGTENINLVLPTGIEIDGFVTDPGGQPIEEASAGLCSPEGDCFLASGATDATGHYVAGRVDVGTYLVRASANGFRDVWLGDGDTSVTDINQAVTIEITGETTLPTLQLDAGFSIAGTITDPDDNGVAGVEIFVTGEGGGVTTTDANGNYLLGGLGGGFFSIEVVPPVGSPFTAGNINAGGTIDHPDYNPWLEVDGAETGIDATLVVGRSISGTITGLAGPADINVSGTPLGRSLEIAPDGTFNATGLWPDELQTIVVTVRTSGQGEDGQFPYGVYDGTPNLNPDQNAWVEIDVSGGDVTGLTLAAPSLPQVTGAVLDELDNPVAGFLVFCSDDLGCGGATLAGDGSFAFINLPDSTYWMYLRSFDHASGYVTASGLSRNFEDRAQIVVAGSDEVVNVLSPIGMSISGKITGPDGEPVEGANPSASFESGEFIGSALTDANGDYVIRGLDAGDYFVRVSGPEGGNYFSGYWSESGYTDDFEEADLIHVPSDGITVVSTTPDDGATGVARTVRPSVTFSASVDVSAAVVSLIGGRMPVAMRGTISYDDATHTLTFTPRGRLLPLSTYVFEVSGLTASGAPVEPVAVTFTTRR